MSSDEKDPFEQWVDDHPVTILYIAVVVTLVFLLQVYQLVS